VLILSLLFQTEKIIQKAQPFNINFTPFYETLPRNDQNASDFIADIFKDGIFLKSIKVGQFLGADYYDVDHQLYFIGDKIYNIDRIKNIVKSLFILVDCKILSTS